jgi:hypothetical protein
MRLFNYNFLVQCILKDAVRILRGLGLVLCILFLSACSSVRYEYYPPTTDGGRQCIAQCSIAREVCAGNENQRAANDRQVCEQQNRWNYQNCIRRANDKDGARSCSRYQNSCWASPNTYRCDENYRSCFVACGGHINVIKEQ